MTLPLEGVRVIDLTVVWAGPFGAALLSDLGAEVIRVESVQRWDTIIRMAGDANAMRADGHDVPVDSPAWEIGSNFSTVGRNRRSVTMDLTRPEGKEAFYRLARVADVFIENNTPDVVHHLGINYEVLRQHNPELIMVSLSAYGATGPYRSFRAYGSNMEAMIGHAMLRGYEDTDPTHNTSVFFADACAGATSAFAILAALNHRLRTGRGQYIDMSQSENVAHTLSQAIVDYSMNGRVQRTMGNRDPVRAPQGVYACAGVDNWVALSCGDDEEFAGLCRTMGRLDLVTDERYSDASSRRVNHDELDSEISAWTQTMEQYEAFHALQANGVPASPVLRLSQVCEDPHLRSRDMWQDVTHPISGTHPYLRPPISHMSKTPLRYWRPAPTLGQDNEYVYKELLGYSDKEYQELLEEGYIGTTFVGR